MNGARYISPRAVVGVFVILLGLAFTLENFGVPLGGTVRDLLFKGWPLVFVLAGLARLLESEDGCRMQGGVVWIAIGLALLADNFDLLDIGRLWPLGLVLVGVLLVWRAYVPPGPRRPRALNGDASARVDALAVLGGARRTSRSSDFRGGSMVAFMGGVEADLREAGIASGEAVIEALAWWGGIEIKVPRGWEVVSRGVALLGGFEDKTQPADVSDAARPRLVVTGFAVMGGVEIKN